MCYTVLDTLAKELVLSKLKIYLCDYAEFRTLVITDLVDPDYDSLIFHNANIIVVRDFINSERTPNKDEMAYMVSWLLRAHGSGVAIVIGGNVPIEQASDLFYPGSLLRLMREIQRFPISVPKK
jgi:hypothetical protein